MRSLKKDSLKLLRSFRLQRAELSVILVNDTRIKELNHAYRNKNKETDVLSFALYESLNAIPDSNDALLGDVVINLHAAKRQASVYGCALKAEVRRLLVHGFLHLLGYDHEKNSYQERKMRKKEHELLNALEDLD